MASYKKLETLIRKAIKQISGSIKEEDGSLLPEVAITCDRHIMAYLPTTRSFAKISCGTKALLIVGKKNDTERILVYTFDGQLAEIEEKYITITGAD
jgi:hypothetical protein